MKCADVDQTCAHVDIMCFLSSSVSNPCKNVCSHLCLLRPGGYTCACPQGSPPLNADSTQCDAGKQQRAESLCRLENRVHSDAAVLFCTHSSPVPLACSRVLILFPMEACDFTLLCSSIVCSAFASAAIEAPVAMPLACRCMNGGTCYSDERGPPQCK